MEVRVLKYFLTVVREENITKAADVLHITQPTLSRQLAQLEDDLGVSLFSRGTRKITLTNEGVLLRRRAEEILELVHKTERELVEQEALVDGTVSIGCGVAKSGQTLADLVASFRQRYPLVTFNIYTATADLVQERIDRGLLDMGLLMEPVNVDKYEYIRLKQQDHWGVFMNPEAPLAKKAVITAENLLGVPVGLASRPQAKGDIANWFGDYYDKLQILFTFNLSANAVIMVHNRLMYMVALEGSLPYLDKNEICSRPLQPERHVGTLFAWKRQQPFGLATTRFIEHAKCFLSMEKP